MSNLITLDLGGLLGQLNSIQKEITDQRKVYSNIESKLKEDTTGLANYKISEADKYLELKKDMSRLSSSFESTNKNMKDIDELVARLKGTLESADAQSKSQEDFRIDAQYKISQLKREVIENKNSIDTKLVLKEDFAVTTAKITSIENTLAELSKQLKTCDDQMQDILDRVETIEQHSSENMQQVTSLLSDQKEEVNVLPKQMENPVSSALAGDDVGAVQENLNVGLENKNQFSKQKMEIKEFLRKIVEKNEAESRVEVFELAYNHFSTKNQALEQTEPEDIVLQQDNNIGSTIEQIIEQHIKQVGSRIVWLEQLKPKWLIDGKLQIGSDFAQVFAHVEIQTHQQQQLMKNQVEDSRMLQDVRNQLDDLKRQFKQETKRIDLLEEGKDVDLSHLNADGAGLKELFRIMQDLKTEILQKSVSKDQLRVVEREILEMKVKGMGSKNSMDYELKEEVQLAIAQMQQFPAQLQSLQMQIMKNETLCYDIDRMSQQLNRRIQQFEEAKTEFEKEMEQLSQVDNEEALQKVKDIAAIKLFIRTNYVSLSQHNEFTEKVILGLASNDQLRHQAFQSETKLKDHSKHLRTIDQQIKNLNMLSTELKAHSDRANAVLNEKVSMDVFNEETTYIKQLTFQGGSKSGAKKNDLSSQLPPQRGGPVAAGGLTPAQRSQIKELAEGFERHEFSLRKLQQNITSLNLDDLKQTLVQIQRQLPEKASKVEFDKLEFQSTLEFNKFKAQMKIQSDDMDRSQQNNEERLNKFALLNNERDDKLLKIIQTVERIEETIVQIRRGNAAGDLKRKLMNSVQPEIQQNNNMAPQMVDDEGQDQLKVEIQKIKRALQTRIETLDRQVGKLLHLVGESDDKDQSKGKKVDLETRINEKLNQISNSQAFDLAKVQKDLDELRKQFEEKIRRQQLVQQQKQSGNLELNKSIQRKPKFLAQQMTRELVVNGRLPMFENYGDHIARYGKGFSQMLNMVQQNQPLSPSRLMNRQIGGVSLGELSDSYQYEAGDHHTANFLTSPPTFQDNISRHSHRDLPNKANQSSPQLEQVSYAPQTSDAPNQNDHAIYLQSHKIHPSTKAYVFRHKKESDQKRNIALTQLVASEADLVAVPWETVQSPRLPMISTSRSINENVTKILENTI